MKGLLFCTIFFLMMAVTGHGQNRRVIDSLEANYTHFDGVDRAAALYELVYYYLRVDNVSAKKYFEECRKLPASHPPAALAYSLMAQGIYHNRNGLLDSAVVLLEQAKEFAERADAYRPLIKIHSALAHTFISSGKAEKGLENLFAALRIVAEHPDQEMEMKLRTNITWAYLELKQYRNCIDAGVENLKAIEGSSFEWIALYTYNNMAVCYGAEGKLDSAELFIAKGITWAKKANDNQSLANAYFILGTIYSNAGKYQAAIEQYLKARPFREKVGNPSFLVSDLYTISDLYFRSGNFRKGIEAGHEALVIAEKYDLTLKLESTYLSLAKNYEGAGDFRNASTYYRMYAVAKDTLYKHASSEAIAEMQTRFDTERKERLLALQRAGLMEQESKIQKTYFIIATLSAVLLAVVGLFLVLRARTRRRHQLKVKEQEILLRDAQIHATIHSQENERRRFAQDLHDGMGQLISALRLALQGVKKDAGMEARVEVVNKGEHILNEMHHEIRSIAFNLMPQTLVQHGLVPALKEMSERINSTGKIMVRVTSYDFPQRLAELEEISLYRVTQEWINNVMKYAQPNIIHVQLIGHDEELTITIEDDGAGFNVEKLYTGSGNGWKNIQSRLNLIKASIEIDSKESLAGTTVVVRIPVAVRKVTSEENIQAVHTPATVGPNTH